MGVDDIDGASLAEMADKVSRAIIGTTLAAVRSVLDSLAWNRVRLAAHDRCTHFVTEHSSAARR